MTLKQVFRLAQMSKLMLRLGRIVIDFRRTFEAAPEAPEAVEKKHRQFLVSSVIDENLKVMWEKLFDNGGGVPWYHDLGFFQAGGALAYSSYWDQWQEYFAIICTCDSKSLQKPPYWEDSSDEEDCSYEGDSSDDEDSSNQED
jgi:hypothetical protein